MEDVWTFEEALCMDYVSLYACMVVAGLVMLMNGVHLNKLNIRTSIGFAFL